MREILFRGKFGNEWKYGFLSIEPQGLVIKEPYKNDSSNVWHIESDTIGQYTGFTDKNGAKIFEGDILAFDDMDGSKGIYEVFWDGNNGKFAIAASGNRNYVDDFELFDELFERNEYFKLFEVIGNIYDSPELLKDETMTLDELKAEISERIESEQEKMSGYNDSKSRKDKHYYISEGMVIAYGIVADYLGDLEVLE
jgi:uncharacterized phage protein (TIGR01671 family)